MRLELRNKLNAIPGVDIAENKLEKRPTIPLSIFAEPESLKKFIEVFDWFVAEVKKT